MRLLLEQKCVLYKTGIYMHERLKIPVYYLQSFPQQLLLLSTMPARILLITSVITL